MNARWVGFAVAVVVLAMAGTWVNGAADQYAMPQLLWCGGTLWLVCLPLAWQALSEFVLNWRQQDAWILRDRQKALSMTAQSVLLEAAKGVHPDVMAALLQDRARRWGLMSGTKSKQKTPYSVLMARPRVTDRFLVHFLNMSNDKTYMAKGMLSDKDKSFDPAGLVTAYEMYDDLESLLIEELKVTRPYGWNKPGYWLAGWSPETVALDYGLDLDAWAYDEPTPVSLPLKVDVLAKATEDLTLLKK